MSAIVNRASSVAAPFPAASGTGYSTFDSANLAFVPGGVLSVAVTGTVVKFKVPKGMQGSFVRVLALGANVQVGFAWGTAGVNLTYGATATIDGSGVITSSGARGGTFLDGMPDTFIVPERPSGIRGDADLWLSAVASGSGQLELYVSEGQV